MNACLRSGPAGPTPSIAVLREQAVDLADGLLQAVDRAHGHRPLLSSRDANLKCISIRVPPSRSSLPPTPP
jgi:hypothetical protein